MKFYVTDYNFQIVDMFSSWGFQKVAYQDNADFIVLPGGGDIDPSYYMDSEIAATFTSRKIRDEDEFISVSEAVKNNQKIIGICRGAQLVNVAAGGFMIQDIQGHVACDHLARFIDGTLETVNSTHHQMMFPFNLPKDEYHVLAWAAGRSKEYVIGSDALERDPDMRLVTVKEYFDLTKSKIKDHRSQEVVMEPEMVMFPKLDALAIQYHPEKMSERKYDNALEATASVIDAFLENKL